MFSNLRRFFSKKTAKQIGIPRKTYGFLHFEEGRNGIFHPKVNLENLEKEMGFIIQRFNDEISNMKANKLSLGQSL